MPLLPEKSAWRGANWRWLRVVSLPPLYSNAFWLWLSSGLSAFSGLVFWMLVARLYPAEAVGLGAAAVSALGFVSGLATLGLGWGLIRFLPETRERAPGLLNQSFGMALAGAVVGSLVFLLGLPWWSPALLFLRQPLYLIACVVFIACFALAWLVDQAFVARRRARFVLLRNLVVQSIRLGVAPALVALASFGVVAAVGIAGIAGVIVGFPILRRVYPDYAPAPVLALPRFLSFGVTNHLSELLLRAPNSLMPLVVVNLLGGEWGAYFYMPWFMGLLLFQGSVWLALSLFAEGAHRQENLLSLTRRGLLLALFIFVVGVGVVFLLGGQLLRLFGERYSLEGVWLLRLVTLAALPASVANLYIGVERVRQRLPALLLTAVVVAVSTLGVSYLLLPRWGLIGAGVGLITGQVIGALIAISQALRLRGVVTELVRLPLSNHSAEE